MHDMLRRCQDIGLKRNPDKCFVKQEKIRFYGIVSSQSGIQPDPSKMLALRQISALTCRQVLQTFLGLENYMRLFIPNLSTLTAPLREPLNRRAPFCLEPRAPRSLQQNYGPMSSEVTLTYKSKEGDQLTSGRFAERPGRSFH